MNTPILTCTATEATLLVSLLGAPTLLGLQDPFVGWLTEEITVAWERARAALVARRVLALGIDAALMLDPATGVLLHTWAFPVASYILTRTPAGGTTATHYFHMGPHLAVEQTQAGDDITVTGLPDRAAVVARVADLLGIVAQRAAPGGPATLPEAAFLAARAQGAAGERAAALVVLRRAAVGEETAQALAASLRRPVLHGALVALARRPTAWEVAGLGLLDSAGGLWQLRSFTRDGTAWVEAIPTDAGALRTALRRAMYRVLSTPLPVG
ncbi:MAG: ESX secretion-associated protein EspG [Chloroflexota bacterium]|nr:ESX secretion-associated protein EspG [Chloroflexota bacterium]